MLQTLVIAGLSGFLLGLASGIVFEIRTGYFRQRLHIRNSR